MDSVINKSVLLSYMVSKSFRLSSKEVEFIQAFMKLKDFSFETEVIHAALICLKNNTEKKILSSADSIWKKHSKNVEFLIAGKLSNPKYDPLLLQEYQGIHKDSGYSLKDFVELILEWDLDKFLNSDEYCITNRKTNKEDVLQ